MMCTPAACFVTLLTDIGWAAREVSFLCCDISVFVPSQFAADVYSQNFSQTYLLTVVCRPLTVHEFLSVLIRPNKALQVTTRPLNQ